jgi:hypothetical protein
LTPNFREAESATVRACFDYAELGQSTLSRGECELLRSVEERKIQGRNF